MAAKNIINDKKIQRAAAEVSMYFSVADVLKDNEKGIVFGDSATLKANIRQKKLYEAILKIDRYAVIYGKIIEVDLGVGKGGYVHKTNTGLWVRDDLMKVLIESGVQFGRANSHSHVQAFYEKPLSGDERAEAFARITTQRFVNALQVVDGPKGPESMSLYASARCGYVYMEKIGSVHGRDIEEFMPADNIFRLLNSARFLPEARYGTDEAQQLLYIGQGMVRGLAKKGIDFKDVSSVLEKAGFEVPATISAAVSAHHKC